MSDEKAEAAKALIHQGISDVIANRYPDREALIRTIQERELLRGGHIFERVVEADASCLLDAIIAAGFRPHPDPAAIESVLAALADSGLFIARASTERAGWQGVGFTTPGPRTEEDAIFDENLRVIKDEIYNQPPIRRTPKEGA